MRHQLQPNTYTVCESTEQCKELFDLAKANGLTGQYEYVNRETIISFEDDLIITDSTRFEKAYTDPVNGSTFIPLPEFISRLKGEWASEPDYKALYEAQTRAIEEAVAEIEARAIKLSKGGTLYEEDKAKGLDEAKEILTNKLK